MQKLFSIDRLMAKSLTKQICDGFKSAIAEGRLEGGARFPTCREICDEFDVSMIVASAVVRQLGREGMIRSRPHVGSFVVPKGSTAWRGGVLFVNAGGTCSAYAGVLAAELRERLTSDGFLFSVVDMPSRFIGRADEARLAAALATGPRFVVVLHARGEVLRVLDASGVNYLVVADGKIPRRSRMAANCVGVVRTDYSSALAAFAEHCRAAGVARVLEVGFEKGYASASSALKRAGVGVEKWMLRETPDFRYSGHVQRVGMEAVSNRLAKGRGWLPDLVYFTDDYLAAGALVAFASHGVKFPGDVRFVSLATKGFEPVWWQAVTRIEWDWFAQGRALARLVEDCLESRARRIDAAISPDYVAGDTFPPAGASMRRLHI